MEDGRAPTSEVALELDDIQSGALQERPSPYVGRYLLLRIDDRAAGRELVRRLHAVVDAGREAHPVHDARATVAFTYQGLKQLGVPQKSLDSFAPEFQQGMAARAAHLGDVGESAPSIGSARSEQRRCTLRSACWHRTPTGSKRLRRGHGRRTPISLESK